MRSLFGLLLLLSYSSHAFTVHSSNTGLLFGGKHATFRHQSLPRAQQHVPLNQPSLLTHASSRIANNNKIVELNACRSVGDNSGASTNVITRIKSWIATFRKTTKALLFGAFLAFACFIESASAVSGGRMGGSFSPSSSRSSGSGTSHSMHRSSGYRSSGYSRGYSQGFAPRTHIFAPSIRLGHPSYYPTRLFHSATSAAPVRRFGVADAVLLGGTGYVLYSAFARSKSGSDSTTALGEGTSVASITLSLTVPDRDDFYSILNKLKRLSESADTSTRQGVQTLVSSGTWLMLFCDVTCTYWNDTVVTVLLFTNSCVLCLFFSLAVAMELLREESSITSAKTTSSHFNNPNQAEREFQRISVQERSKFDKETGMFSSVYKLLLLCRLLIVSVCLSPAACCIRLLTILLLFYSSPTLLL